MRPLAESLDRISAFVSGKASASEFEQQLYRDPGMESLLSEEGAPRHCHTGTTLFHYLIGLDYGNPGRLLDAQDVLAALLKKHGIETISASAVGDDHELLLSAQPRWLDVDVKYLSSLLASSPPLPPKERKAWLRRRLLELFRCAKTPPRWLQSPSWPMGDAGPLVFLGQFAVNGYFHDDAAVFVFHDPATGRCTSIVQVA